MSLRRFDGSNFNFWKEQMQDYLIVKGQIDPIEYDIMPYPYPRYTDGPDAESHIRAFISTWQENHSTHRLTPAEVDASKIAEFTLSLDGPAARWYSRLEIGEGTLSKSCAQSSLNFFIAMCPNGNCSDNSSRYAKNRTKRLRSSRSGSRIFTDR